MPTVPFGPILESALKSDYQGGKLSAILGVTVDPIFHCCISGTTVQVAKDPVALMTVSARRICPLLAVTVDYSHSYSPSSTLNSWTVDWGDGNVSTGAWPGAGHVSHPLFGYQLPGHYHIVLTVTDLLGATGQEHTGITVEDCIPPVALMGGCGSSGVYYTSDSGVNWINSGGGEIDGVLIRDIKATYQSIGSGTVHMWAATEQGLYRGQKNVQTGEQKWVKETLPLPIGYITLPDVISVSCSRFYETNVMVLLSDNVNSKCWLYRGEQMPGTVSDSWMATQMLWTPVQIITTEWVDMPLQDPANDYIFGVFADASGTIYHVGDFPSGGLEYEAEWWNGTNWQVGIHSEAHSWETGVFRMCSTPGDTLFLAGNKWHPSLPALAPLGRAGVLQYNMGSTTWLPPITQRDGDDEIWAMAWQQSTGRLYVGGDSATYSANNCPIQYYHNGTWYDMGADVWDAGWEQVMAIKALESGIVYIGGEFDNIDGDTTMSYIAKWNGVAFEAMDGGANDTVHSIAVGTDGSVYAAGYFTLIGDVTCTNAGIARYNGQKWCPMGEGDGELNDDPEQVIVGPTGIVYALGYFTATMGGTPLYHIAQWDTQFEQWRPVPLGFNFTFNPDNFDYGNIMAFDAYGYPWFQSQVNASPTFKSNQKAPISGTFTTPTVGFPHLMDIDASGIYVYVTLLDAAGFPTVIRISTDLADIQAVYAPAAGTWAGVACDPYFYQTVWAYGDFGAVKVTRTDDYGQTWADQTDGTWGGGEVVRPLLLSYEDSGDVIAILNGALQVWQKWGADNPWVHRGSSPFAAACGCRNYIEPMDIWIGLNGAGAAHIQYSPNEGVNWIEHSGDFPAAVPVNALTIIGGQDYWT